MAVTYTYDGDDGDIQIDFTNQQINCEDTITNLQVQELIDAIREAEASTTGIVFPKISEASGKEYLDPVLGVQIAITVELLGNWKIYTQKSSGNFKVWAGNLIRYDGGDPLEPNTNVNQVIIQSAASTIVTISTGSGLSNEQNTWLSNCNTRTETIENEMVTETTHKGRMFEKETKTIDANNRITKYGVNSDEFEVEVTYNEDGVPTSESVVE